MRTADLFADAGGVDLGAGVALLKGFALPEAVRLVEQVRLVVAAAPFRQMMTPGGLRMSVAMTNCGAAGWITDRKGYRYSATDPENGRPWPELPGIFSSLAERAARAAGFPGFAPDACLINRYAPGSRMSLHQDRDERSLSAPIVSVSLGLPATFLFGGQKRSDRPRRLALEHGDVVVWGAESRLNFHGVAPLVEGLHPLVGGERINLTLRQAL